MTLQPPDTPNSQATQAQQADPQQADPQQAGHLKANAIGVPGAIAMSIAIMAPAAGMMFVPQVVAGSAGAAVPLVYLISLIGSLFVANTIVQFARRVPHAGSFFAYNTAGLGRTVGFLSGWLLFAGYFVFYPQNILACSYFISTVLEQRLGLHITWVVFAILIVVLIWYLSTRGISNSMKTDLYFVTVEVLVILAVCAVIFLKGGAEGFTTKVFTPAASPTGWGGIFFGMIFGMMTFMGFEAAATVAEETANPRRNIPRAVWGAVIGIGIFYVVVTYALSMGYGVDHGKDFAQATTLPMDFLATRYAGSGLAVAVDVAGIISAFAVSLALNNAAVRVIFAMGRDSVLPKQLGTVHTKRLTPTTAINLVGIAALGLALIVGLASDPYPDGYGYFGAFGTLPILLLYAIASISLIRYVKTKEPNTFNWWKHGLAPAIGAALMLLPIYGSIFPIPAWPYNLILGLVAIFIIAGIFVGLALRRKSSHVMERVAHIMATGGDQQ